MNADLGLTTSMYGLGVGMFYISYILFEIPSNVIMTKVGPTLDSAHYDYLGHRQHWHGVCSHRQSTLCDAFFATGMAEAGFAPGIIYYISCWFPKSNRARAMSFFYMGSVSASIIGLPVSGAILNMHGIADIAGWRWLFALEGIPALILGCLVLWPARFAGASPVVEQNKNRLRERLQQDNAGVEIRKKPFWWSALKDKTVLLLSLVWFLQAFGSIGITLFMPR
ncbi:MFS transporter (plasmid) [Pseudomonas silvicola]|nr:MFS transporter [Pseudomonas silvicola]